MWFVQLQPSTQVLESRRGAILRMRSPHAGADWSGCAAGSRGRFRL